MTHETENELSGTHPESQMLNEKVMEAASALASTPGRKLLPCPFCGEADQLYPGYRWPGTGVPHSVDCLGCGIDFIPRKDVDAIDAWNRRSAIHSQEAAPSDLVGRLIAFAEITPEPDSGFSRLNSAARALVQEAIAALASPAPVAVAPVGEKALTPAYWKRGLKHGVQYAVKQLHFNDKGSALAWICDHHPSEFNDAMAGWSDEAPVFSGNIWADVAAIIPAAKPAIGVLTDLADWCSQQGAKLGAVDGYSYHSGEEAAYRHVSIEATKRAAALSGGIETPKPEGAE